MEVASSMCLGPCGTRWGSWFQAVLRHISAYVRRILRVYAVRIFFKCRIKLTCLAAVASFTCIGTLGTLPPTERGPSLESIYWVSLTVDLCEGNKLISFKQFISPQPVAGPSKRKKNPGALGTCPVCPSVKTALPNSSSDVGVCGEQYARRARLSL